jgi:GxxExxY protein
MHVNEITERIIGAAIEVHRHLGPGLAEASYERALRIELEAVGLHVVEQPGFPVFYKGRLVGRHRPDFVVENAVVVEIKAIERLARVHKAQMITYLRVTKCQVGLTLNFCAPVLRAGIDRTALQTGEKTL